MHTFNVFSNESKKYQPGLVDYIFIFSLFFHQPFVLYKALNIELGVIILQYFVFVFLCTRRELQYSKNEAIVLIPFFLFSLPLNLLWGSDYVSISFFIRILPSLLYLLFVKDGLIITLRCAYFFFAANVALNIIMFILYISGAELHPIDLEFMSGYTIGYLSFAVQTAFFNTGDPFLARLQGWAWEPAAFAIATLPLIYNSSENAAKILPSRTRKICLIIIYSGLFLTKSLAFFASLSTRLILTKFKFVIAVIFLVAVYLVFDNTLISIIFDTLANSSLDERSYQSALFYDYIDEKLILFGAGYAAEGYLGMPTGQTSVLFRYLLFFGVLRVIILFAAIFLMAGIRVIFSYSFMAYLLPIIVGLLSLDISLGNVFLSTLLSSLLLDRRENFTSTRTKEL